MRNGLEYMSSYVFKCLQMPSSNHESFKSNRAEADCYSNGKVRRHVCVCFDICWICFSVKYGKVW